MKKLFLKMGLLGVMLMTVVALKAATTAKWDFKNDIPAGIREATNYQNMEADIESSEPGIFMHVDATNGKLYCIGRDNAQFNAGTILRIPVSSTKDVVTVEGYPGYSKYHYGNETEVCENTTSHTVTNAELKQGYVEVVSDGGYIYCVSVVLNKALPEPDVTGTWDFGNADVMEATMALSQGSGTVKAIEDNGILLTVESNGASFRNNGNNIQMRKGTVLKVPVKNAGDIVKVKGYPNYSYYTIGDNDTEITNTETNPVTTYTALRSDATQGFVVVASTNDNNYFYALSVEQKAVKQPVSLEDEPATATFPFDLGTSDQTADFGEADDYFISSKVVLGSGLIYKGTKTDPGFTETAIEPTDQNNNPDETNIIQWIIQPKHGFKFTPTEVAFKTTRFGTDNGLLDIAWLSGDGTVTTLATEVKPIRNNTDPKYNQLTYAITDAPTAEGPCGLQVNLYHLQSGKQIGFADIVIKGVLNGVEVEVPILEGFTANGVNYLAEKVFEANGDEYVATIELSKAEEMISESNPVSDVKALSGEVGDITYSGDDTKCTVTIPVTLAGITINYVANFVQKPDFTLTYLDTDKSVMGIQLVEKDAAIGEFAIDYNTATAQEGYKVRGWFEKSAGGRKYTTADIV
ncbi:MAG: hypothetical protein IKH88_07715, partial [Prevotella sp.]|nr:hypothetical protein [Prevotella sp.]